MKSKKNFGLRLRKCRENVRLSQLEVSKILGIHNSTYGKYELGVREPDVQMINKMADLYNVDVDWLIGRTDNPKTTINKNGTKTDLIKILQDETEDLYIDGHKLDKSDRLMWARMIEAARDREENKE